MKRFLTVLVITALLSPLSANSAVVGDINQDGKIDLMESIYALQVASGVYPSIDHSCLLTGQGAWIDDKSYNLCDVVISSELTYACTTTHTSIAGTNAPPNTTYWTVLSIKGDTGPVGPPGADGITSETDPTVLPSVKDGISWGEVSSRPAGLDDGDDIGITTELDPTVASEVKDGVSWNEVSGRPAGLDDGDDIGLTSENDPQVGTNTNHYIPRWNGSALVSGSIYDNTTYVGIGTANPGSTLDVNGDINTTGVLKMDGTTVFKINSTDHNTFIGMGAGQYNLPSSLFGNYNTFIGKYAGQDNETGYYNSFFGNGAGTQNTEGNFNTFIGKSAGSWCTTGDSNTFIGLNAGFYNSTGSHNTFIGKGAGLEKTGGGNNTFIGVSSGLKNISGSLNTFIGNNAGYYETGSNKLYIDNSNTSTPLIYGEFDNDIVAINGRLGIGTTDPLAGLHIKGPDYPDSFIHIDTDSFGQDSGIQLREGTAKRWHIFNDGDNSDKLRVAPDADFNTGGFTIMQTGYIGVNTNSPSYRLHVNGSAYADGAFGALSDRRHKEHISDLSLDALQVVKELRPVTFNWKEPQDNGMEGTQLGFIAQEVEEVLPETVMTQDNEEQTKGLKYSAFIPILTKAIQELEKENEALKTLVCLDHPDASICQN